MNKSVLSIYNIPLIYNTGGIGWPNGGERILLILGRLDLTCNITPIMTNNGGIHKPYIAITMTSKIICPLKPTSSQISIHIDPEKLKFDGGLIIGHTQK